MMMMMMMMCFITIAGKLSTKDDQTEKQIVT